MYIVIKKVIAILFLLLFLSLTIFLIYTALQPEKLPVGKLIPVIEYRTIYGMDTLKIDSLRNYIVVYFHSECKHCQYELSMFNKSLKVFKDTQIVLLTPDKEFFSKQKEKNWPELTNATNVVWGIVNPKTFKKVFGTDIFPAIYFFNRKGILYSKVYGEAKLEKILSELKKSGLSGHQISGHN